MYTWCRWRFDRGFQIACRDAMPGVTIPWCHCPGSTCQYLSHLTAGRLEQATPESLSRRRLCDWRSFAACRFRRREFWELRLLRLLQRRIAANAAQAAGVRWPRRFRCGRCGRPARNRLCGIGAAGWRQTCSMAGRTTSIVSSTSPRLAREGYRVIISVFAVSAARDSFLARRCATVSPSRCFHTIAMMTRPYPDGVLQA